MHAKKVLIPFLLLLALVPLCACTATVPTPGVSLPQLVIGSDNYPPYNYTDENGFPAGVDVALAREACRRIGYEPVFRLIDWDQKDEFLQNGEVDCLWGCFSMNNREEKVTYGPGPTPAAAKWWPSGKIAIFSPWEISPAIASRYRSAPSRKRSSPPAPIPVCPLSAISTVC